MPEPSAPGRLQKIVESIAISHDDALAIVRGYQKSFQQKYGRAPESLDDKKRIAARIARRYSTLSAASGALTAAPGIIPGFGTAVAVGGGLVDISATLKIQIDMCMCLVVLFDGELGAEDKKHLAYVIALGGSIEQIALSTTKPAVEMVTQRLIVKYLSGPVLIGVKQLFKKIGVTFVRKAAEKSVPFGVGVVFSGTTNYLLTTVVSQAAIKILAKEA